MRGDIAAVQNAILGFGGKRDYLNVAATQDMNEAVRSILQPNEAAASDPKHDADPGFLWDFWYPALRSTDIRGRRLVTARLLEVPLVLGRTADGQAFAMRDSCPHR